MENRELRDNQNRLLYVRPCRLLPVFSEDGGYEEVIEISYPLRNNYERTEIIILSRRKDGIKEHLQQIFMGKYAEFDRQRRILDGYRLYSNSGYGWEEMKKYILEGK